jgi:hypothetical protein
VDARRLLSEGIDPSQHKQQRATQAALDARSSFKHVAEEYIAKAEKQEYVKNTINRTRWLLRGIVIPKIGDAKPARTGHRQSRERTAQL